MAQSGGPPGLPRDAREWWRTADRKEARRFLTTTNINGVIGCLRRLVADGKTYTVDEYRMKLVGLDSFKFESYHSSQYNRMGEELQKLYFS